MDIILTVFLPLSLAFIMFSLGLGLTVADFTRVALHPLPFAVGAVSQVIILPLIAFWLLHVFPVSPEFSLGVMILALSPGGVTSNFLTKLAGGALALSISLTGVISLLSVITVPLFVALSASYFLGHSAVAVNVTSLAIAMFLITVLPVVLGLALRHFASELAIRIEPVIVKIATILFVVIVIGAVTADVELLSENLIILGPILISLIVILLVLGFVFARLMRLDHKNAVAISIETGVQNATLGITVGSLIATSATNLPLFSLPSAVYGITMYFVIAPFIFWMRRRAKA